nr:MAG TPA: hypothetical protein [Caudoviricetes sp.]
MRLSANMLDYFLNLKNLILLKEVLKCTMLFF